jgi:hypothetical protein
MADGEPDTEQRARHMDGSAAPRGYEALYRPSTGFNRVIRRLLRRRAARSVTNRELARWADDSLHQFSKLGANATALSQVRRHKNTGWLIADAPAPSDVWCGEVVFGAQRDPLVIMYPDSPWGRLPAPAYDIASQIGVDHMVAHLYEYYLGGDIGEERACLHQVNLLLTRGGYSRWLLALLVALSHRLHKHIPLGTYAGLLRANRRSTLIR